MVTSFDIGNFPISDQHIPGVFSNSISIQWKGAFGLAIVVYKCEFYQTVVFLVFCSQA
jgi:hypothetical protein